MIAFELCASGDTLFQPLMVDWVGGPATILASEICFICWHSWWRHFFILLAAAVAITQNTRHNFHHKTWLILWSRNEFVNANVGNSISKIFNNWIDAIFISKVTNYIISLTIHGRIGSKKSKYWACNASCLFCRRPSEIFISDESKCRQHWLSTIWCHVLKAHFLKAEAKIICGWPMCIIGLCQECVCKMWILPPFLQRPPPFMAHCTGIWF